MQQAPLISCLCVSKHRAHLLRRSVACFLDQTWPNKELVLVYQSDDHATAAVVESMKDDARLRSLCIDANAVPSLGALRNLSVAEARGEFIAQWDDDDWHGPARLAMQLDAMRKHDAPACVLTRTTLYDALGRRVWVAGERTWECTLVARRAAMPAFPDLQRGEDTPVVIQLRDRRMLLGLDFPELYIYTFHGKNTWEFRHWEEYYIPYATPLGAQELRDIEAVLGVGAISDATATS